MNKLIKQAFTLIELLVVIAIIGILSGLIVVSMSGVTQKANIAKAQVFSNSLRNSLMANIVGEWKFDGPTGDNLPATSNDVLDTWGGINNGTIPAAPAIPTIRTGSNCVIGSCLSFDGGDYVSTSLYIPETSSISLWFNTSTGGYLYNFAFWNDASNFFEFLPTIRTDNGYFQPWAYSYVGGVRNDFIFTFTRDHKDGKWHNMVISFKAGIGKMWLDGTFLGQDDVAFVPWNTATNKTPFSIGRARTYNFNSGSYSLFNGLIDDVRIYNEGVSTFQVEEQYYSGLNKLLVSGGISEEEYLSKVSELAIK